MVHEKKSLIKPDRLQTYIFMVYKYDGEQPFKSASYQNLIYIGSLWVLIDFSHTVKAATLIFISGRGSPFSSAKEGNSSFIYNLVKS